ncbi:aldose 1-epimerase [Flavobacterium resistens]|uniref:Aldose 1-epimerase n=1 Tax=Flavobacterium resistens TaxID=443612 RepID=A0A521DM72_9FLAO|nr:aldose epimerase family protein [Flavobacterium resistens]MRX68338.1 galactose-1-epimerase [Flavobacterium resistens]SMO72813.1 aldose 1-epimerase [Flavobacterium resistens]
MEKLEVITIKNKSALEMTISNFGATVIGLKVKNSKGEIYDVAAGLKNASDYLEAPYSNVKLFLGSSIGRYAGRISGGEFEIDDIVYKIENQDGVHLHGGENGFFKKFWSVKEVADDFVVLSYLSKNNEEGYPGNLNVEARFELTPENEVKITYTANTDLSTPVNLTSHVYFNLNGKGSVLDHELQINSDFHLDVDSQLLPTGKLNKSEGTDFDRNEKAKIRREDFKGYDDTFVFNENQLKASLSSAESGINMDIFSNQPAMVVYTPKEFPVLPFSNNDQYEKFPAICFEPQNFPDAPNKKHFPDSILRAGENYLNEMIFAFTFK